MINTGALEYQKQSNNVETNILRVVGFSLFMACFLIFGYSPFFETSMTISPVMHGITHGCMFLAMAFSYLFISNFAKFYTNIIYSRPMLFICLILELVLPFLVLLENFSIFIAPVPALLFAWVSFGYANSVFFCAWTEVQSYFEEDNLRVINLWVLGLASCIITAILAMPRQTGLFSTIFVIFASFAFLLKALPKHPSQLEKTDEYWISKPKLFSTRGSFILAVDGIIMGFIAGLLIARVSKGVLFPFIIGLAFLLVAFIFILASKKANKFLAIEYSQWIILPVLIICLPLAGFLDAPYNTIFALPLFMLLYVVDYTNLSSLTLRGNLLSLSPTYCFAKGRFFIIFGQGVGWFAGAFIASDFGHGSLPIFSIVMAILICVYISISNISQKDQKATFYVSETENMNVSELDNNKIDPCENINSGNLNYDNNAQEKEPVLRPYKNKCHEAAKKYCLTPRETEILLLLAKGRNAKYIGEQLYVTERTVKTHIYHIYQKMNIHTQQELINIVDNIQI